jgi:hypothetical protein
MLEAVSYLTHMEKRSRMVQCLEKLSRGTTEAFLVVPGGAIFRLDENGSKRRALGKQVKFVLPKIKFGRRFSACEF